LMISMIAAALRRAVQRLMSSGGWFIEALLSGCNSAWGYPPQAPASCRQLDRARCCLATLESTLSHCFRAYWMSNFCGGRSTRNDQGVMSKHEVRVQRTAAHHFPRCRKEQPVKLISYAF